MNNTVGRHQPIQWLVKVNRLTLAIYLPELQETQPNACEPTHGYLTKG